MDGRRMEAEPVQGRTFVIKLLRPPLALAGSAVLVAFKKIDFALLKQSLTHSVAALTTHHFLIFLEHKAVHGHLNRRQRNYSGRVSGVGL